MINWTLRLGLGLLKQVKPISQPWLAILDHSIDIGTKKVLVVLRVPINALFQRGQAIQLKDCECIGVKISEIVNGESIALELKDIFTQAGMPEAIIKDNDYTLQKGVRLWSEIQKVVAPVIEDIGHVMAGALRVQFEETKAYQQFITWISQGAKCLRQTKLAFLAPPKLRSKGRFQSISKLGQWAERMLAILAVKGRAKKESVLAKLRIALPGFSQLKSFLKNFSTTTKVVSSVTGILKNKGLDQNSYEQCYQLSETLSQRSKVKECLQDWLQRHIEVKKQITSFPLLVSSDIIESLFGNFKHVIERSPQADMNRTVLLIPALCGNLNDMGIEQAFKQTSHRDLECWDKENIPYTIRKKRQAFFAKYESQKAGKI